MRPSVSVAGPFLSVSGSSETLSRCRCRCRCRCWREARHPCPTPCSPSVPAPPNRNGFRCKHPRKSGNLINIDFSCTHSARWTMLSSGELKLQREDEAEQRTDRSGRPKDVNELPSANVDRSVRRRGYGLPAVGLHVDGVQRPYDSCSLAGSKHRTASSWKPVESRRSRFPPSRDSRVSRPR